MKTVCLYFSVLKQWYQQSYWHSVVQMQQVYQQPAASPPSDHTVPQSYPEPGRTGPNGQGDIPANGQCHPSASNLCIMKWHICIE